LMRNNWCFIIDFVVFLLARHLNNYDASVASHSCAVECECSMVNGEFLNTHI
jgi:hypothetical protein